MWPIYRSDGVFQVGSCTARVCLVASWGKWIIFKVRSLQVAHDPAE